MTDDDINTMLRWPVPPSPSDREPSDREPEPFRAKLEGSASRDSVDQHPDPGPPVEVADPPRVETPFPALDQAPTSGAASPALVIQAYDRLADRVLDRLRELRDEVDTDLGGLRSQMEALRQAVDDVGDPPQLRQLRSAVDEMRSEVASAQRVEALAEEISALRADVGRFSQAAAGHHQDADGAIHGVVDSVQDVVEGLAELCNIITQVAPDLRDVAEQVAEVRHELGEVRESVDQPPPVPELPDELLADLAEIRVALDELLPDAPPTGSLGPLLNEVVELRGEVIALRRRISLRGNEVLHLEPGQIKDLARLVAEYLDR